MTEHPVEVTTLVLAACRETVREIRERLAEHVDNSTIYGPMIRASAVTAELDRIDQELAR